MRSVSLSNLPELSSSPSTDRSRSAAESRESDYECAPKSLPYFSSYTSGASLEEEFLSNCYQSISNGQAPEKLPFSTDCSLIFTSPSPHPTMEFGGDNRPDSDDGGSYMKVGEESDEKNDVSVLDNHPDFDRTTAASDDSRQVHRTKQIDRFQPWIGR